MPENPTTCSQSVVNALTCRFCNGIVIKHGKSQAGKMRYRCKDCTKTMLHDYTYKACKGEINLQIIVLTKEGCGIRSTARILNVSPKTILWRIIKIARNIERPYPILKGKSYEVDELFTYLKHKDNRICIAYSLEKESKNIINFAVGRRNKTNLRKVTETLVLSESSKITTDKLNIYKELIPTAIHSTKFRGINRIERNNLTLRTHLKRLSRRTICYSKSLAVLTAVVKIYFWG